ncbi:TonB-dependent receptor [Gallaecimonas kandeliae]|uniref:TonB-dependent receptor n=1 Tax=Gallaecimonas kandeliae TaxID=3029055 RepID=UPI0026486B1A|nr:TonB-dependent receptor [Gallaecimonas kandeliae]WKE65857.1 TonB-dependent receptor [Gallaecimonas kandeliae]
MDRKFIVIALSYAIIGMLLGIAMAISQDHGQLVTHAHIMLAGFVVSFVYGLCHKLWLGSPGPMAQVQFYLHQVGVAVLVVGLFLLYGNFVPGEKLEPVLASASLAVLAGMVLMLALVLKAPKGTSS